MNIAFFVQYSHAAGTYFRWHNLAIALQELGHEIDIYAGDHSYKSKIRHEVKDGVNYYITPSLPSVRIFYVPNDFITGLRRAKRLPEKDYDVYHLFQPFANAYLPWKVLRSKKKKSLFIFDWDDLWNKGLLKPAKTIRELYFNKITIYLEKKIPFLSDGVTVCSTFLQSKLPLHIPSKILSNGYWPKELKSKVEMRKKWGLEDSIFYISYIGKTAGELDWILDSLDYIDSFVNLIIAGPSSTFLETIDERKKAKIKYLGEVTPEDAREIATASDLGLIPLENSLFNQSRFPIKFFDFLSVHTPVYMSEVGEIANIARGINSAIIGSSDREEWVKD